MTGDTRPTVLDVRIVSGAGGGPDKTILNSPRFLNAAGYRMLCAYLHSPDDRDFERLQERARLLDAMILPVPDRGPLDWRVIPDLLKICRRENVQIWHGHDYKSNFLGLLLKHFWPMRLVSTVHGWVQHTRRTPLYYAIDRLCLKRYDNVLCVSRDLFELCVANGVRPDRCSLLANAIDTNQYTRSVGRVEAKRRLGIGPDRIVIGAIGRLSAEKGFDTLIRAVDQLVGRGLNIDLLIAGEGSERHALTVLIATLGLHDRIRLLGHVAETAKLYEAMDVFVVSSVREGLPNVLLEAMAMGVPMVATRVGGIPAVIRHENNGMLVSSGSPRELADAVSRLLGDSALRERLANEAHRDVLVHHSFQRRMEKLARIYDALLSPPPRAMEAFS